MSKVDRIGRLMTYIVWGDTGEWIDPVYRTLYGNEFYELDHQEQDAQSHEYDNAT